MEGLHNTRIERKEMRSGRKKKRGKAKEKMQGWTNETTIGRKKKREGIRDKVEYYLYVVHLCYNYIPEFQHNKIYYISVWHSI